MSKEVELIIEIDKQGNVVVTPKGTQGKECLDLMKFLDKIDGIGKCNQSEYCRRRNEKPAFTKNRGDKVAS
jgi:hypothetical protein